MQNEADKIPCTECGVGILPFRAKKFSGLCKTCFDRLPSLESAGKQTNLHQNRLDQTKNILRVALGSIETKDYWEQLNVRSLVTIPASPELLECPAKPEPNWVEAGKKIEAENQKRKGEHMAALEQWKEGQIKNQEAVSLVKAGYESLEPEAVKLYCKLVLQFSDLPDGFRSDFDLEYIPETKILIIDHALPAPDDLNRVKEVEYVQSKHELVEVFLSEREFDEIYDDALYQTCLRTIHELFHADTVNALAAIVFNGWIESVDKATGNDTKGCVLSVQAKKEEFQKINLARVDPKACFKALQGIGSSTLHSLTPIAPVLKIHREDKRFVASHEVAGQMDERFNLAAMAWEDFEHLVRELFEKEFSRSGSEVKVTQASRDGGVDAVVFDPDPIHGGKTVIQAKRYTNTVGVAAVRELYGTVLNEGAMKGILVTTADYGPDAYEFAKGKPLVLLNGANLLHLLEKHGHRAKIDLQEAKRLLGQTT